MEGLDQTGKDLAVYKLVGTGSTSHWEKIEGSIVNPLKHCELFLKIIDLR